MSDPFDFDEEDDGGGGDGGYGGGSVPSSPYRPRSSHSRLADNDDNDDDSDFGPPPTPSPSRRGAGHGRLSAESALSYGASSSAQSSPAGSSVTSGYSHTSGGPLMAMGRTAAKRRRGKNKGAAALRARLDELRRLEEEAKEEEEKAEAAAKARAAVKRTQENRAAAAAAAASAATIKAEAVKNRRGDGTQTSNAGRPASRGGRVNGSAAPSSLSTSPSPRKKLAANQAAAAAAKATKKRESQMPMQQLKRPTSSSSASESARQLQPAQPAAATATATTGAAARARAGTLASASAATAAMVTATAAPPSPSSYLSLSLSLSPASSSSSPPRGKGRAIGYTNGHGQSPGVDSYSTAGGSGPRSSIGSNASSLASSSVASYGGGQKKKRVRRGYGASGAPVSGAGRPSSRGGRSTAGGSSVCSVDGGGYGRSNRAYGGEFGYGYDTDDHSVSTVGTTNTTGSDAVTGAGIDAFAVQDAGSYRMLCDDCSYLCGTIVSSRVGDSSGAPSGKNDEEDDVVIRHTAVTADAACDLAVLVSNRRTRGLLLKMAATSNNGASGSGGGSSAGDEKGSSPLDSILDALSCAPTTPPCRGRAGAGGKGEFILEISSDGGGSQAVEKNSSALARTKAGRRRIIPLTATAGANDDDGTTNDKRQGQGQQALPAKAVPMPNNNKYDPIVAHALSIVSHFVSLECTKSGSSITISSGGGGGGAAADGSNKSSANATNNAASLARKLRRRVLRNGPGLRGVARLSLMDHVVGRILLVEPSTCDDNGRASNAGAAGDASAVNGTDGGVAADTTSVLMDEDNDAGVNTSSAANTAAASEQASRMSDQGIDLDVVTSAASNRKRGPDDMLMSSSAADADNANIDATAACASANSTPSSSLVDPTKSGRQRRRGKKRRRLQLGGAVTRTDNSNAPNAHLPLEPIPEDGDTTGKPLDDDNGDGGGGDGTVAKADPCEESVKARPNGIGNGMQVVQEAMQHSANIHTSNGSGPRNNDDAIAEPKPSEQSKSIVVTERRDLPQCSPANNNSAASTTSPTPTPVDAAATGAGSGTAQQSNQNQPSSRGSANLEFFSDTDGSSSTPGQRRLFSQNSMDDAGHKNGHGHATKREKPQKHRRLPSVKGGDGCVKSLRDGGRSCGGDRQQELTMTKFRRKIDKAAARITPNVPKTATAMTGIGTTSAASSSIPLDNTCDAATQINDGSNHVFCNFCSHEESTEMADPLESETRGKGKKYFEQQCKSSPGSLALAAMNRILTGKDGDGAEDDEEEDGVSDDSGSGSDVDADTKNDSDKSDDEEDAEDNLKNPLMFTNVMLRRSGSLPVLAQAMAEAFESIVQVIETGSKDNDDAKERQTTQQFCLRCLRHLSLRASALFRIVDGACCLSTKNRKAICGGGSSTAGIQIGVLVPSLLRLLTTVPFQLELSSTLVSDIVLSALRTLTSLTHENDVAAAQMLVYQNVVWQNSQVDEESLKCVTFNPFSAPGKFCALNPSNLPSSNDQPSSDRLTGVSILFHILHRMVSVQQRLFAAKSSGRFDGSHHCYDIVIFCLNTLTNIVETASLRGARRQVASLRVMDGHEEKESLRWLASWLTSQTESFRSALMKGSFGMKVEGKDAASPKESRDLEKHEEERLVTAGNGFILLACLMKEGEQDFTLSARNGIDSLGEDMKMTEDIRNMILSEMPVDEDGESVGVILIIKTLKAFLNLYYGTIGALSVAIVTPVLKLISELEKM